MISAAIIATMIASLSPSIAPELRDRYAADLVMASDGDTELAVALLVTQHAEASFRRSVETCEVTGDHGAAITSFQVHAERWDGHSRAELCASNVLAATVAGKWLARLRRVTGSWRAAFVRYIGARTAADPHMRDRHKWFDRLLPIARRAET